MSAALETEDRFFESLYRRNRPAVYAYALSRVRNSSDAEDVTQTTFLNAYTALDRGVRPRDELQWLIAIARNLCHDRFRDAKRRPAEEPLEAWTPAVEPEATEYSVGEVCRHIAELDPRHRRALLMREFEGRSYAEISTDLGVSEPAVQAILVRARRTLRDELELGLACSQARRISLRHQNDVATVDERRALQRHLRRCGDCATFVGVRPRRSIARLLWLPTLPFRKLGALVFGTTGAPVATSAGGGGALAAKLLALAAIGTTAVGVTARHVGAPSTTSTPSTPSHPPPAAPALRPAPAPAPAAAPSPPTVHRPRVVIHTAHVASRAAAPARVSRPRPTHETVRITQRVATKPVAVSAPRAVAPPAAVVVDRPPPPAPAEAAPEPPAPPEVDAVTVPEAAAEAPSSPPPATDAPPVTAPPAQPAALSTATPDANAASAVPPVETDETATVPAADADATSSEPPAAADDAPAAAAEGNADTNGHGDELGVGRGGTPPGHGGPSPDELGPPGVAATQAGERARGSRS